jgi:hypothetical protein
MKAKQNGIEQAFMQCMSVLLISFLMSCLSYAESPVEVKGKPVLKLEIIHTMITNRPFIEVYETGQVICAGFERQTVTQVSKQTIADVLRALETNRLYSVTSEGIQKRIKDQQNAQSKWTTLIDGATTTLTIELKDRRHSVSCYALEMFAAEYPEIDELKRMSNCVNLVIQSFSKTFPW